MTLKAAVSGEELRRRRRPWMWKLLKLLSQGLVQDIACPGDGPNQLGSIWVVFQLASQPTDTCSFRLQE